METRFYLGKIDFVNSGRNRNKVFATFCDGADLCPKGDEHLMLSFEIKMANNHGNECCNQCQGVLAKYPEVADTLLFKLAMNLTKKYGAKPFKLWDRGDREIALALCNAFRTSPSSRKGFEDDNEGEEHNDESGFSKSGQDSDWRTPHGRTASTTLGTSAGPRDFRIASAELRAREHDLLP